MNPGDRFARFTILREIRSDDVSSHYEARCDVPDDIVMLRVFTAEASASQKTMSAMREEVKAIAKNRTRPHIYDVGFTDDGLAYVVMERISI